MVSCSPEEGTRVSAGSKVELSVASPYPSEWNHVSEYFGHNSATIATYLAEQGFTLSGSYLGDDGYACALYSASDKGNLLFTSAPWTNSFDQSKAKEGVDVLSDGTQFMGLRLEIAGGSAPATEDGVKDVMESCGLSNMQGICSQYGITVPPTTKKGDQVFACAYGQMGNCYWTVLVEAQGSGSREVVTCASTSCYSSSELAAYGGRVCDYVAALDVYGTATTGQDSGQSAEQSTGQN